jgi:hypothetical protein
MAAPAAGSADHISALPDGVLQHVLGFLEADEAVRTSVLARRWRCLWRFMAALPVTRGGTVSSSRNFLDHLLDLRGRSALDACLFRFTYDIGYYDSPPGDDETCLNRWTRHALSQGVQKLSVDVQVEGPKKFRWFLLDNLHVVSQSLAKLRLEGVVLDLQSNSLDFSSCPALKELNLTDCYVMDDTDCNSSTSLACLSIHECFFSHERVVRLSTPNLISLQVTHSTGLTPIIGFMPALEKQQDLFSVTLATFASMVTLGIALMCRVRGVIGGLTMAVTFHVSIYKVW